MILNRVRLQHTVIFIRYIANEVALISPLKTLTKNKMVLLALNSLTLPELVENELEKTFSESI